MTHALLWNVLFAYLVKLRYSNEALIPAMCTWVKKILFYYDWQNTQKKKYTWNKESVQLLSPASPTDRSGSLAAVQDLDRAAPSLPPDSRPLRRPVDRRTGRTGGHSNSEQPARILALLWNHWDTPVRVGRSWPLLRWAPAAPWLYVTQLRNGDWSTAEASPGKNKLLSLDELLDPRTGPREVSWARRYRSRGAPEGNNSPTYPCRPSRTKQGVWPRTQRGQRCAEVLNKPSNQSHLSNHNRWRSFNVVMLS